MVDKMLVSHGEALSEIPTDAGPDGVAEFLLAQGCKGYRWSNVQCPVTAYIAKRTGYASANYVATHQTLHFVFWEDPNRYPQEIIPLPETVGRFLRNFDDFGTYPALRMR